MSTKYSTKRKNLDYAFAVFFNLDTVDTNGKSRLLRCKLSLDKLTPEEQQRVLADLDNIGNAFFMALAPSLRINVEELMNCERRHMPEDEIG